MNRTKTTKENIENLIGQFKKGNGSVQELVVFFLGEISMTLAMIYDLLEITSNELYRNIDDGR